MQIRGKRTQLGAYIAVCAASGIATLTWSLMTSGPIDWRTVAVFGAMALLAETFAVTTALGSTYSVTFVVTIAAVTVVGPAGAIVASLFGTTGLGDARQREPVKHLFNASQIVLATAAAAYVFNAVAGSANPTFASALLGAFAAAIVNFIVNTGLVSGAIGLSTGALPATVWRDQVLGLAPADLAYAVLGLLLGILYGSVGWGSLIFFLVPLLVARNAFHAAIQLHDALDRVVTTLIGAIDEKDPCTGGHATRVSVLAEDVARAYGLSAREARAIRYAALIHDVGKLAVHNQILQKPGALTEPEHAHMRLHTEHGVELARGIDLLAEVLDGIRHHHERWDGGGYPAGLVGERIPVAARIISVSDAFDAITSERPYSAAQPIEEALTELRRCAGSQFDPNAVTALEQVIRGRANRPRPESSPSRSRRAVRRHRTPHDRRGVRGGVHAAR